MPKLLILLHLRRRSDQHHKIDSSKDANLDAVHVKAHLYRDKTKEKSHRPCAIIHETTANYHPKEKGPLLTHQAVRLRHHDARGAQQQVR